MADANFFPEKMVELFHSSSLPLASFPTLIVRSIALQPQLDQSQKVPDTSLHTNNQSQGRSILTKHPIQQRTGAIHPRME